MSIFIVFNLTNHYYSGYNIRKNEMAAYGERRCAYRVLVGKPKRNRAFRRPRHEWDDILAYLPRKRIGGGRLDSFGSG